MRKRGLSPIVIPIVIVSPIVIVAGLGGELLR